MSESETDLGPRKTMFVIVIVVGCFAVLWPKVFYPMLVGPTHKSSDYDQGCCDVFSESDINTIKVISELCTIITQQSESNKKQLSNREIATNCKNSILNKCGIDISPILQDSVNLNRAVKNILEKLRSFNGSLCLKYQFGVSPFALGVPHKTSTNYTIFTVRQERPTHLRPEMLHPALKERGRAIPPSQASKKTTPPPKIIEGKPRSVPGMRPPMGGAGHVVPPSQKGSSISVIMPIYTVGIVIFFAYTLMKVIFKKKPEGPGLGLYPPVEPDQLFRKEVFESEKIQLKSKYGRNLSGKLGRKDRDARDEELDLLRRRLRETELAMERIMAQMAQAPFGSQSHTLNGSVPASKQQDQASVKVLGMETTASCEGGQKWSRPESPIVSPTPPPPVDEPEPPQEIYLEGALPPQSQLLVSDSKTETQPNTDSSNSDPAVVLASKMTLSVISLDSLPETENGSSSSSGKDREEYEFVNKSDMNSPQDSGQEFRENSFERDDEFESSKKFIQTKHEVLDGEISNDEVDIEIDEDDSNNKRINEKAIDSENFIVETESEEINEKPSSTMEMESKLDDISQGTNLILKDVDEKETNNDVSILKQEVFTIEKKQEENISNEPRSLSVLQSEVIEDQIHKVAEDLLNTDYSGSDNNQILKNLTESMMTQESLKEPSEVLSEIKEIPRDALDLQVLDDLTEIKDKQQNSDIGKISNEAESQILDKSEELKDKIYESLIVENPEDLSKFAVKFSDNRISLERPQVEEHSEIEEKIAINEPKQEIIREDYYTLDGSVFNPETDNIENVIIEEEIIEVSDEEYERLEREMEEKENEEKRKSAELEAKVENLISTLEAAKEQMTDVKETGESSKTETVTDLDEDDTDFDFNKELERIKREMSEYGFTVDEDSETDKDSKKSTK